MRGLRLGWGALALVALGGFSGCSDDGDERTVRKRIGNSGGQITSHDGFLTILFLPGSLSSSQEISITPSDTPPPIFGPAYRVRPDVELEIDAEVTYNRILPNDPTGAAVAAVRRASFESGEGQWIALPTIELDVDNQLVTGIDSELSLFYGLLEGDDISGTTGTTTLDPTNVSGNDSVEPTDTDTDGGPLSHAADIQPIWEANCFGTGTGCHTAGEQAPNLEDDAYGEIVDGASLVAAAPLVTAGDSALSYLMHKLDATHTLDTNLGGCGCAGSGSPMPLGTDLLPQETRDLIRTWIDAGAMP